MSEKKKPKTKKTKPSVVKEDIFILLEDRGYSSEEIKKILGLK